MRAHRCIGTAAAAWLPAVGDFATFESRAARSMAWTRVSGEHAYPCECDPSYGG